MMIGNLEFLYSSSLSFRVPVMFIIIALVKTKQKQKNTHATKRKTSLCLPLKGCFGLSDCLCINPNNWKSP